jgi:hypothetical protein
MIEKRLSSRQSARWLRLLSGKLARVLFRGTRQISSQAVSGNVKPISGRLLILDTGAA